MGHNDIEKSNQLNLTVVALVALVAIVGLVALVMNTAKAPKLATGGQFAQAKNAGGQATSGEIAPLQPEQCSYMDFKNCQAACAPYVGASFDACVAGCMPTGCSY